MYCPTCGKQEFDLFADQQVQARLGVFSVERGDVVSATPLGWRPTPREVDQDFVKCRGCGEEWEADDLSDSPPKEEPADLQTVIDELVEQVVTAFPSLRNAEEEDEYSGVLSDEEKDTNALDAAIRRLVDGRRTQRAVDLQARARLGLEARED